MKTLSCTYLLIAWLAFCVSGCASFYPLPIKEPPAQNDLGERTKPDYQRGGLHPAKNIVEAIENTKIYADAYQIFADKLRGNEYISSDVALAGGVLGVAGGLTKSVETAIAGAIVASGSSIISQRYQFLVQAANYEKASDAMYCMYTKLYPVNGGGISETFANERIDEIRRKLRKYQSSVQLANPDLAQLETSLKKVIEKKKTQEQALISASGIAPGSLQFNSAQNNLHAADLELLKSELEKCVAAF